MGDLHESYKQITGAGLALTHQSSDWYQNNIALQDLPPPDDATRRQKRHTTTSLCHLCNTSPAPPTPPPFHTARIYLIFLATNYGMKLGPDCDWTPHGNAKAATDAPSPTA